MNRAIRWGDNDRYFGPKGSWKGGTVGHSIAMLPGELHGAAFARYCEQHEMTLQAEPEG
jgi:hypothetical protein